MTPEQITAQQLGAQAINLCTQLAKSGALPSPSTGRAQAVLGTAEHAACVQATLAKLKAGLSPEQASQQMVKQLIPTSTTPWLLIGGVVSLSIVAGTIWYLRRKS